MRLEGARVVVFGGATGLLGQALASALKKRGATVISPTRHDLQFLDPASIASYLDQTKPALVFNTVAYTAVDQAEDEPDAAAELNTTWPRLLGQACQDRRCFLVHYSTDFVFSGSHARPISESEAPSPTSVYGGTKLDGENELAALAYEDQLIIRTAWLFGPGKINFVEKILGFARQRDRLTVVDDQFGSPTYTPDLAEHSLDLLEAEARGLFHLTNSGPATWHELASQAVSLAGIDCRVDPVPSSAYPTKATRPAYSVLSTAAFTKATGLTPRPWIKALKEYVRLLQTA